MAPRQVLVVRKDSDWEGIRTATIATFGQVRAPSVHDRQPYTPHQQPPGVLPLQPLRRAAVFFFCAVMRRARVCVRACVRASVRACGDGRDGGEGRACWRGGLLTAPAWGVCTCACLGCARRPPGGCQQHDRPAREGMRRHLVASSSRGLWQKRRRSCAFAQGRAAACRLAGHVQ